MEDARLAAPLLAAGGVLLLVLAWLGRTRRLRRNPLFGIRLPSTTRSDAAWFAAHEAGATAIAASGAVALAGAALAWAVDREVVILVTSALVIAGVMVAAAQGAGAARRIDPPS